MLEDKSESYEDSCFDERSYQLEDAQGEGAEEDDSSRSAKRISMSCSTAGSNDSM